MTENDEKINQLLAKMADLLKKQEDFSRELDVLKTEINLLRPPIIAEEKASVAEPPQVPVSEAVTPQFDQLPAKRIPVSFVSPSASSQVPPGPEELSGIRTNFEKIIGENLINKIGIAITVIGVGIGAKYAIDNQLISPLARIILGYLFGTGMLLVALKLKKTYENFSAVLLSGSMAILYFITYAAYDFYGLLPHSIAFGLMVIFTIFTVMAALRYNRQVIAHIGLVGAYAVPFLLSNDSGKPAVLFTYIALINSGILAISVKKYWRELYYSSFTVTSLTYFAWYSGSYQAENHFLTGLLFATLFFVLFYLTFLAYKLVKNQEFEQGDILLLLANAFIYFGFGYSLLTGYEAAGHLPGSFTLANALAHFVAAGVVYRNKAADRNLLFLVSGLVLVFVTIAVPVQFDGHWVSLLWVGQALLLFWIARTRSVGFYEKFSYALMLLAFISICHDWGGVYDFYHSDSPENRIPPFKNIHFLSTLLFTGAFGFINYLYRNRRYPSPLSSVDGLTSFVSFFIPAIFLLCLYSAFYMEIYGYWTQRYLDSAISGQKPGYTAFNYDLKHFRSVWLINYSLFFLSLLGVLNIRKIKSKQLGAFDLGLTVLTIAIFLTAGLYALSMLRDSYLYSSPSKIYDAGLFHTGIRYVSLAFFVLALTTCYHYMRQDFMVLRDKQHLYDLFMHLSVLWIVSSELINQMEIARSTQSYKLGLSILWGVYSLFLVVYGILKRKKYLRIAAIGLFGATLLKLFLYDISHLDTIAKTIVLVSLGILLLIISFLYNKYKTVISEQ